MWRSDASTRQQVDQNGTIYSRMIKMVHTANTITITIIIIIINADV